MLIRKLFITILTTLLLTAGAWAQNNAAIFHQTASNQLQLVQMRAQQSQAMMQMAQQLGNYQEMQQCQMEMQMHQMMYNQLGALMQNPQQFQNPQVQKQFTATLNEYNYRCDTRDMRPYAQIQGRLQQYVAHQAWKSGTPEGRAAHQGTIQGIQGNTAANTANHNNRMQTMQGMETNRNNAWANNQAVMDNRHNGNIHAINNEYQYVNPNTNEGYWVNMYNTNPAVQNADGSWTQLTPYHNY